MQKSSSERFNLEKMLPGGRFFQALRERGIVGIVNVSADLPCIFEKEGSIKYLHIPVQDWESEQLLPFFEACCEYIDAIRNGALSDRQCGVLVHCAAGISRSSTVVIAYMMWKDRALGRDAALALVKEKRRFAFPNDGFMDQLGVWEMHMRNGTAPSNTVMGADGNPPDQNKRCFSWVHRSKALYLMHQKERAFHFENGMLLSGGADLPCVLLSALDHVLGTGGQEQAQNWLVDLWEKVKGAISAEEMRMALQQTILSEDFLESWKNDFHDLTDMCARILAAVIPDENEMRMIFEDKPEVAAALPVNGTDQDKRELNESVSVNQGKHKTGVCAEKIVREGIKIARFKASSTSSASDAWSRLDP